MSEIDDDGKIWLRGHTKPEYGIRIGELYFVISKEDSEQINCFIHENNLLVDLHNSMDKYRIILKFSLDLKPSSLGTLFNGFKKTKHADIKAITYKDKEVKKLVIDGETYQYNSDNLIDPVKILQLAGWK